MEIVILNLDKDTERLQQSTEELAAHGLSFKRIPGILDSDKARGFSRAMISALEAIPDGGIIFEDDIQLEDFYIPRLPSGWDMLYFGANLQGNTRRIRRDLVQLTAAWTTHAILYSGKAVKKILEEYRYQEHGIYDNWLKEDFIRRNKCYMVTPMIAYQRPDDSRLFGGWADYRQVMDENYSRYVK